MEDHSSIVRRVCVVVLGVLLGAGVLGVGSCASSGSRFTPSGNPLLDVRNPELRARDRVAAAERAWREVESGVRDRSRTREAFKSLAWSTATDDAVRQTLVRLLLSDRTPEGEADSLSMARLMLPTERSPEITRLLAAGGVERGWDELIPALVRSYARMRPGVSDSVRVEREAIGALRPGVPVEETIYSVFVRPSKAVVDGQERAVLRAEDRARDDAWTLLSRLDAEGRLRARLIGEPLPADADEDSRADVETLRAGLAELGALPRTGAELAWLRRLHRHEDAALRAENRAWWAQASGAIAGLRTDQRRGLELRHAEAVRWASAERPEWLAASRQELLTELASRLSGRSIRQRSAERGQRPRSERLRGYADRMSWGDVLTVLVVDEALASEGIDAAVFEQTELDRRDTTTEYGGVLDVGPDGTHRLVLFRPRARDRISDDRFVASSDMIRFSDRALAHYHLQVQRARMASQAGPSEGDLVYAADSGRTCLVFTSVGSRTLNVDVYTPDGVIIDLGMVHAP
ncbi:MAG: hypothetical protein LAT64_02220 [Phycisphaerales bacterium]|nr:hypothetical protein [Planctomycetota bacterium]MCH8507574.1 hypothetical protein [Phycisphaerales bacterium]